MQNTPYISVIDAIVPVGGGSGCGCSGGVEKDGCGSMFTEASVQSDLSLLLSGCCCGNCKKKIK